MYESLHAGLRRLHDGTAGKLLCALACAGVVVAVVSFFGVGLQAIQWYFGQVKALNMVAVIMLMAVISFVVWVGILVGAKRLPALAAVLALQVLWWVFFVPAMGAWPGAHMKTAPLGIHVMACAALTIFFGILAWPLIRWTHRLLER